MTDEPETVFARPVVAYSIGFGPAVTGDGVLDVAVGVRFVTADFETNVFAFAPGDAEGLLVDLASVVAEAQATKKPPRPLS